MTQDARKSASVGEHFSELSSQYDDIIKRVVTHYDTLFEMLFFFIFQPPNQPLRILDLGTGSGNVALMAARQFPHAELTLVDLSAEMLELAQTKIRQAGLTNPITLINTGFMDLECQAEQFDLILASLSLHHLTNKEKPVLYHRLFQWLKPGGAFRCADGVFSVPLPLAHEKVTSRRQAESRALGATEADITQWQEHELQFDHFASLQQHMNWLSQTGFTEVDCYWKHLLWAVFGAQKHKAD